MTRRVALVTGVGRLAGLGAALAVRLAVDGFDVATTHWSAYDERMPWGPRPDDPEQVAGAIRQAGARTATVAADLSRVDAPATVLDEVERTLGPVSVLVLSHAESVDSGLLDTDVESLDRHLAVNVRASWLLVKEFAQRFPEDAVGRGRIVALTSDAVVGNVPYGASKGALDRIVLAAARELSHLKVSANVVNPGPVDTGWMDDATRATLVERQPTGRLGTPGDVARLVRFLVSPDARWVTGQLITSDGGFSI